MNLEQIWSALRKVEKAEDLAEWRVGDIYLWQVIRERMFTHIAEQSGLYLPVPEKPPIKPAKQASLQAAPLAIMPFVRRDAQGRDPFTEPFIKAADDVMVFAIGSEDEGSSKPQYEQLDAMLLAQYRLRAKLKVVFWQGKKHKKKWQRVIASLEADLGVLANIRLLNIHWYVDKNGAHAT